MGFFLVMKAELVRTWIIMRRYWFRTVTGIVIGYGMLMVLIVGFMASQDTVQEGFSRFEDPGKAVNYLLGFIIGMYAFAVVGMFTQGLQGMARTGVLEQLCMSPYGLVTNFLARTAVGSVSIVFSSGIMVWMVTESVRRISNTTDQLLYWHPGAVILLLVLTFINLLGFGFMVGGLVLVFKQVGQVAMLIRMGLFGLAIFASASLLEQGWVLAAIMHVLPITDAAICLKHVLLFDQGNVLGEFVPFYQLPSFFWLMVSCVAWTVVGITCFELLENHSRTKGTLGAY